MDRIVATLKAQNKLEAFAALDLLKMKIREMALNDPIEEQVVVTNEGTVK